MTTDQEIQQAIDACRPGSEDLQQPEMALLAEAVLRDPGVRRRYERSLRFDAGVRQAFRDVPVPDGLGERLLAAVDSARGDSARVGAMAEASTCATCSPANHEVATQSKAEGRWPGARRRRVWSVVAGTCTAIAVLAAVALLVPYFRAAEPLPDDRLPGEILAWSEAVVRQGWNEDLLAAQALTRPLDRAVRANPRRWCSIATAYDSQTVVYDVASRGGELALVFCMRCPVSRSQLPPLPPGTAFSATGGLTLGVWRRGDLVYVLAVRGGPNRYRQLIESSPLIGLQIDVPFSPAVKA